MSDALSISSQSCFISADAVLFYDELRLKPQDTLFSAELVMMFVLLGRLVLDRISRFGILCEIKSNIVVSFKMMLVVLCRLVLDKISCYHWNDSLKLNLFTQWSHQNDVCLAW